MSVFFALVRRELGGHFNSLTGYVVIAAVLLLTGFGLVDLIERIRQMPYDAPVTELFYQTTYFWLVVLLTSPVITMRTYAAEKATGTYEALMTTPVGDWQVVLAKFSGALVFFLLTWVPFIGVLFSLRQITGEAALFEPVIVAVTKVDKIKPLQAAARVAELTTQLGLDPEQVIPFSARTGAGRDELGEAVEMLVTQPDWRTAP